MGSETLPNREKFDSSVCKGKKKNLFCSRQALQEVVELVSEWHRIGSSRGGSVFVGNEIERNDAAEPLKFGMWIFPLKR